MLETKRGSIKKMIRYFNVSQVSAKLVYSHSGYAFNAAKAATTFLVTLVTSCTRRLVFKFFGNYAD
jgi:hypothetical protein